MNLHLVIPALNWPDISQHQIYQDLPLPSLEKLLSKSSVACNPPQEIEAWLCETFNVTKQQNWPIAPIMLHNDSSDAVKTNQDYWIHADPVHLRIEQNHIMLADSQAFQITNEEAKSLTKDINQSLSKYDLSLLPLHPKRWYIRTANTPELRTHSLSQVTCNNINNFLPSGKDSIYWHKIFNEIQMLLHEHPINQAREAHGELTINSIWFWGGGHNPQPIKSPYTKTWSNHVLTRALSLASNTVHSELPLNAKQWEQFNLPGTHLIMLDTLLARSQYKDAYNWRNNLAKLEEDWFKPLYAKLKQGKIKTLTITALNETKTYNFSITPTDLWKIWLPAKLLSSYADIV